MLTLTQNAENAIREILAASPLPDGAGVRIATDEPSPDGARFRLSLVGAPEPADRAVEEADVPVYLEPGAQELLQDAVLDAEIHDDRVTFSVGPTASA